LLILYADGGCVPNPGNATYGVVAVRDGRECYKVSRSIGHGTNNIAEWRGAIAALTYALYQPDTVIELRLDSELVVKQFNGQYRVKKRELQPLANDAKQIAREIEARGARVTVLWIPREQNTRADWLTQARGTRHAA
jgi:ribonuclease HI